MSVAGDNRTKPTKEEMVTIHMFSLNGQASTPPFEATTIQSITADFKPYELDLASHEHLKNLELNDPPDGKNQQVDILLSGKICNEIIRGKPRTGRRDEPSATPTTMGWVLSGEKPGGSTTTVRRTFVTQQVKSPVDLTDFWSLEHQGILPTKNKKDESMTLDELDAMNLMRNKTTYNEKTKTYHSELLWRQDPKKFLQPNYNRAVAVMNSFRKKMAKDPEKLRKVDEQYHILLSEGFADTLTPSEIHQTETSHYTLESHAVFKEKSLTTKVRLVHNAASKDQLSKQSLNDMFHTGPNLLPELASTFVRFRLGKYAIIADISKMFFRIKLPLKDQNYLRMVWHFTDDKELTVMRMNSLPFGLACSPFMAIWVVQHNAEQFKDEFPAAKEVVKHIYMDDLSYTCDTKDEIKNMARDCTGAFGNASMGLHKWACNDQDCLSVIEKKSDTTFYPGDVAGVLGAKWNFKLDEVQFDFCEIIEDAPTIATKRSILSQTAQIFDVIGVFQPFVLKAKIFMQQLWSMPDIGWDTPLPPQMQVDWKEWCREIPLMQTIVLPRWIGKEKSDKLSLACFGDASLVAIGCAIYSVITKPNGKVISHLVFSRARVAPKKMLESQKCSEDEKLSIARLELLAALLTATAAESMRLALDVDKNDVHLFTDSMITLHRVIKGPGGWKQWVGARIRSILLTANSDHWYYINTEVNPSDLASRGVMASELINNKLWLHGPPVLQTPIETWEQMPNAVKEHNFNRMEAADERETQLSELFLCHRATIFVTQTEEEPFGPFQQLFTKTNNYDRLKRILAYMMFMLRKDKEIVQDHPTRSHGTRIIPYQVTPETLRAAEIKWLQLAQRAAWPDEVEDTTQFYNKNKGKPDKQDIVVKKKSDIANFNPRMHSDGLMRAKTRLADANIKDVENVPILLPKHNALVEKLIIQLHVRLSHAPRETMLATIRQQYLLVGGRQELKRILFLCKNQHCRKLRPLQPRMAPLPAERFLPEAWVHIATDILGPIHIKHACYETENPPKRPAGPKPECPHQNYRKVWIIVWNCLSTRCIHLQLLNDMSTETVIQALTNLISRRGAPRTIWSDNGRNYTAAQKEIKRLFDAIDKNKLMTHGATRGIEWKFSVPTAPNQNGVSEACVKLTKNLLFKTFKSCHLDWFQTEVVLLEVEAVLNNRPLRVIKEGDDYNPITPSMLCLGRSLLLLPDTKVKKKSTDITKMLAMRQQLMSLFWKRWIHQYLVELAPTKKWLFDTGRTIKVGDIVQLREDKLKKNEYQFAAVIALKESRQDGVIRSAMLRTKKGEVLRPLNRLALFEEHIPSGVTADDAPAAAPAGD